MAKKLHDNQVNYILKNKKEFLKYCKHTICLHRNSLNILFDKKLYHASVFFSITALEEIAKHNYVLSGDHKLIKNYWYDHTGKLGVLDIRDKKTLKDLRSEVLYADCVNNTFSYPVVQSYKEMSIFLKSEVEKEFNLIRNIDL